MSNKNIIRAWKDPIYRNCLSEAQRATLPPNPAGAIEISDADLGKIAGGRDPVNTDFCTLACPTKNFCPSFLCTLYCPTKYPLCPIR